MFVQTEITPNPNSLKFIPGKSVSLIGPIEVTDISRTSNELIKNILSIEGVKGVFLSDDFISVNKQNDFEYIFVFHFQTCEVSHPNHHIRALYFYLLL